MPTEKKKKNSQLIIRISQEERNQFVSLCDTLDTSAAREVRRFIRSFLAEHQQPIDPRWSGLVLDACNLVAQVKL